MVKPFPIKRVMASNARTDLDDTERARGAFARLGFGKMRNDGTDIYPDREFFDAMGSFQTYHRLDPDEAMKRNRVGGFLAVPASHTTGHTFYVPRRFPSACNAR